jgi:multiple sugar transport system permease protein
LAFNTYPLLKALDISLRDWSVLPSAESPFVGLKHYAEAASDPIFATALRNTALYALVTVPGQIVLGLAVALGLNQITRLRTLLRTLYYLPVVTSWVVVSLIFKFIFAGDAGLANVVLRDRLGVIPDYLSWLAEPVTALLVVMLLGTWKGIGWTMVIFLAGLQGISRELLEAAAIDGAGRWSRFRYITLPLLRPAMLFVLVMLLIGAFNVFISVYLLTGGKPLHQTEVLLTYMYQQAFDFLEFSYGAAISYVLAIIVFALSLVQLRVLRRPALS